MKTTKRTLKFFSVADWEAEENYLRKMHCEGWKFVSGGFLYTFERCEPEDVIYQLDYNEDARKDGEAYRQLFADAGWEYVQEFGGYSYFRKPASEMKENEEGIFCDDASRLEMVKRVWAGRMVPILIVLAIIVIPYVSTGLVGQSFVLTGLYWLLFLVYIYTVVRMCLKFFRLRRRFR